MKKRALKQAGYTKEAKIPVKYIYSPSSQNFIVQICGKVKDKYIEQTTNSQINLQRDLSQRAVSYFRSKTKKPIMYKYNVYDDQLIQSLTAISVSITASELDILTKQIIQMTKYIEEPELIISCKIKQEDPKMQALLAEIQETYKTPDVSMFESRELNTKAYSKFVNSQMRGSPESILLNLGSWALEGQIIYVDKTNFYVPSDITAKTALRRNIHIMEYLFANLMRKSGRYDKDKFMTTVMQYYLSSAILPYSRYDQVYKNVLQYYYQDGVSKPELAYLENIFLINSDTRKAK